MCAECCECWRGVLILFRFQYKCAACCMCSKSLSCLRTRSCSCSPAAQVYGIHDKPHIFYRMLMRGFCEAATRVWCMKGTVWIYSADTPRRVNRCSNAFLCASCTQPAYLNKRLNNRLWSRRKFAQWSIYLWWCTAAELGYDPWRGGVKRIWERARGSSCTVDESHTSWGVLRYCIGIHEWMICANSGRPCTPSAYVCECAHVS